MPNRATWRSRHPISQKPSSFSRRPTCVSTQGFFHLHSHRGYHSTHTPLNRPGFVGGSNSSVAHTSGLQSLMRISYAVFVLTQHLPTPINFCHVTHTSYIH